MNFALDFSISLPLSIKVLLLLMTAHIIIHAMWSFKIDPDTSAIPYLTALGDLLGSSLLLGAFAFLRFIGHEYEGIQRFDAAANLILSTTTVDDLLLNSTIQGI